MHRLAASGKKILVLERGDFLPREKANWDPVEVFQKDRYHNSEAWLDKEVTEVETEVLGQVRRFSADIVVVACGAINSAALLLSSVNDRHPQGLANGSDQVGRNFMKHHNGAILGLSKKKNPTSFQKTMGFNDFYWGEEGFGYPMGHVQLLGKIGKDMLAADAPKFAPGMALETMAEHAVGWWLTGEDLPHPALGAECRQVGIVRKPVAHTVRAVVDLPLHDFAAGRGLHVVDHVAPDLAVPAVPEGQQPHPLAVVGEQGDEGDAHVERARHALDETIEKALSRGVGRLAEDLVQRAESSRVVVVHDRLILVPPIAMAGAAPPPVSSSRPTPDHPSGRASAISRLSCSIARLMAATSASMSSPCRAVE